MLKVLPVADAGLTARQRRDLVATGQQVGHQRATDEATATSHENASHIPVFTPISARA
jgi:hypothetical protein